LEHYATGWKPALSVEIAVAAALEHKTVGQTVESLTETVTSANFQTNIPVNVTALWAPTLFLSNPSSRKTMR
jgi:hypothetical protein